MQGYVKRRGLPTPGSIPAVLDMFRSEVRFYREIAPVIGVRVPACHRADSDGNGTLLVLEDLSDWQTGADPVEAARLLADLHARWAFHAADLWPWLRPVGAAAALVETLYGATWPKLAARKDLPSGVRRWGERLVGRVIAAEQAIVAVGPITLVHGDASLGNMRTSASGEIVLLDWEDVCAAPGVLDLAWLLVSSVEPQRWGDVIDAYGLGDARSLVTILPAVMVQGLLSVAHCDEGSADAMEWIESLQAAADFVGSAGCDAATS